MLKVSQLNGFGSKPAAGGGGGIFTANAVDFNGSTDYVSRATAFSGAPNTGQMLLSAWFRTDGGAGTNRFFIGFSGSSELALGFSPDNKLYVTFYNGTLGSALYQRSLAAYPVDTNWHHILLSVDHNAPVGSRFSQLYIDDVDAHELYGDIGPAFTIDYGSFSSGRVIGAYWSGAANYNGALSEVFIAPGQKLDLSVESNRRKFISSLKKPVSLGSDGSAPTGVAPLIYLKNPAATVNLNAGTGGNFTINGSPADASTSPSD